MAIKIKMPNLSQTTGEVKLLCWLVKEGDYINKGDPVCEVETDKVTMPVETFENGTVLELLVEPGTIVEAGTVIALLGNKNEKIEVKKSKKPQKREESLEECLKYINGQEKPAEWESSVSQKETLKNRRHRKFYNNVRATPLVQNLARKKNIDLKKVKGTGPGGLITKQDFENYFKSFSQDVKSQGILATEEKNKSEIISAPGKEKLIQMYKKMLLIRQFEQRVYFLFLEGKMPGTVHQYIGMEACAVGVCSALKENDIIASTHRPHGHAIARGIPVEEIIAELYGKETGCCKGKGGSMHIGDISKGMLPAIAIVGANIPIVMGMALAFKMRGESRVAVSFFGDGASNEGAFHEGLNMAAVYNVPAVFVCENNLYGASTRIDLVMKLKNIADRASAYGMRGDIADGMDVLDVYTHAREAVELARSGKCPTLLELKTFRLCGHSRRDPSNYISDKEKNYWQKRDPVPNFEKLLLKQGVIEESRVNALKKAVADEVEKALRAALDANYPAPEDTLKDLY